jgi:hypothetical protein
VLLKHPLFLRINEDAFKEIAAVADPWLGWSWDETESDGMFSLYASYPPQS